MWEATSATHKLSRVRKMNEFFSTAELIDMGSDDFAPRRIKVTHRDVDDTPAMREYYAYMAERLAKRSKAKSKRKANRLKVAA